MTMPYVKKDEKGIATLYVKDRPFFARAGEIHNSSASDPAFLEENVWPALRGMHMNSVIVPVYWEMIEETEGIYDFASVDAVICGARKEGLKLILLWFGLWKNAESMYVPGWVKQDPDTYFRIEKVTGERTTTISPLCAAAVEKDRAAFTALMRHIRNFDADDQTVIVMQVENEIGILHSDRDYSAAAKKAFSENVPEELAALTGKTGTWTDVFAENAGESFMAWRFGKAVEAIASSGRAEYPLPCYVNAWLRQYPWYPGSYPSGGPADSVIPIWKCAAPSLFACGPDVYVPYCADIMDIYASDNNPLFIPEIRKDAVTASYALYAFGAKNALCYSPFGIEDLILDPAPIEAPPAEILAALNIDPTASDITGSRDYLSAVYGILEEIEPLYLKYRGTGKLRAFVRHGENDNGFFAHFTNYDLMVSYARRQPAKPLGSGLVIELAENTFLLTGMCCTMQFAAKAGDPKNVDVLRLEEGSFKNGEWQRVRILNGDEKMRLAFGPVPELRLLKLYRY